MVKHVLGYCGRVRWWTEDWQDAATTVWTATKFTRQWTWRRLGITSL